MPLSHTSFGAFHLTFLALALGPATASAASSHARSTAPSAPKTCTKAPVEIVAGSESTKIALAKCDGSAVPASVAQLSALARPAAATKTHKLDARVAERLEVVAEHFRKERVPKYLGYFERILKGNGENGAGLASEALTYADLSLFQVVRGLQYAFPIAMESMAPKLEATLALTERVAQRPKIAAYLASERRIPFNEEGIFRHYSELDGPI